MLTRFEIEQRVLRVISCHSWLDDALGRVAGVRLGIRDSKATAVPSPPPSLPPIGSIRPDASARITTVRRTVNPATGSRRCRGAVGYMDI
jgi:hypothetical protein